MPAITSTFRSGEPSLGDVLRGIHVGKIQLPDFQRGWVWDEGHIRALIASISLSYPVGAIMLLETGGDGVKFQPRPIAGVSLDEPVEPEYLILDGQQRMTSLYLSLRSGKPVETKTDKGKKIDRVFYLNITDCLDESVDRIDAVRTLPPERKLTSDVGRKSISISGRPISSFSTVTFLWTFCLSRNVITPGDVVIRRSFAMTSRGSTSLTILNRTS